MKVIIILGFRQVILKYICVCVCVFNNVENKKWSYKQLLQY